MMKRGNRVVGYVRVSTREQGDSGLGLAAQRSAIDAECAHRGWTLEHVYEDIGTGKDTKREGLAAARAAVESGLVSGLVVAKMDRLSRSMLDFVVILRKFTDNGWGLVIIDGGMDTSTAQGRAMAHMLMTFAELERELISERTKAALAEVKARGGQLGRPSRLPEDVARRIVRERAAGGSLRTIAEGLNADGVPTGQGGDRWYASTISAVLDRHSEVAADSTPFQAERG